ncbi:lipase member H-B-like [Anoplophora glabripennis]|uniref:lipase member H-B-like n=1 Tax=Anoplophora glabripennis TaxID=217634 RepID=UPI000C788D45|nr:lipase member H-B-like [Anoplophora glabripennis]
MDDLSSWLPIGIIISAKIITHLILDLIVIRGALLDRLILIGHSLGGQITGLVGKYFYNMTGLKLPRIIALDPAGPLFNLRPEEERLNKHDADIVEVIHTDGRILGFKAATGTIDFFLNGGSDQPGCWNINFFNITTYTDLIYCGHRRAYQYFVEAILNPRDFIATECSDWVSYKAGKCDKNKKVSMGDITVNAQGNFYLETIT